SRDQLLERRKPTAPSVRSAAPRVPVANGVTVYRGSANATPSSPPSQRDTPIPVLRCICRLPSRHFMGHGAA
ncbi:hypothetical protein ACV34H_33555, partial [Pseudomonas aeruginosa]